MTKLTRAAAELFPPSASCLCFRRRSLLLVAVMLLGCSPVSQTKPRPTTLLPRQLPAARTSAAPPASTSGAAAVGQVAETVNILPTVIDRPLRVAAGIRVVVDASIRLVRGGSLTLEPGVVVAFREGTGLIAEGGSLQALGSQDDRVVFTAKGVQPRPGHWHGILFTGPDDELDRAQLPVSLLENVVIEYGGAERGYDPAFPRGGLVVTHRQLRNAWARGVFETFGTNVAIRHVELRHNAQQGLYVSQADDIVEAKGIAFGANQGISAKVDPNLLETLGTSMPETVIVSGTTERSMTFRKLAAPYVFEHVSAVASKQPITITIEEGTTVAFSESGVFDVNGDLAEARLIAHRVTFTSMSRRPAPGSWFGLGLFGWASADLEENVFEYSGQRSPGMPGHAAVHIDRDEARVHIARCVFRHLAAPAIAANSCQKWAGQGNVAQGQPLCRRH